MAPEATESATRGGEGGPTRLSRKTAKQRTLDLIKSLEPEDDERTGISKKISWILRHGAQKVNVKMDAEGWVKVSDLLNTEILEDVSEELLMAVIVDSNAQKLRYKLKDGPDGQLIKAYSKTERKATTGSIDLPMQAQSKSEVGLRQDAPAFVPSGAFSPAAAMSQLGYPWPLAGGFGFPPMMPQWPGAYPPMAPPFMMEGAAGVPPGRYRGRIKSFNPEKGFGFIECPETHAQFSRDVFLHKAQFGDMTVGTEVTFLVETNKQGMPQAKDLAPLGGPVPSGQGKGGRGKSGKGGGRGKGGRGQGKGGERAERGSKGTSKAAPTSGEPGPTTSATSEAPTAETAAAEAPVTGSPSPEVPPAEAPAVDVAKEAPAAEAPLAEAPSTGAPAA